mgnify:CR=1 FL=1
MNSQILEVILNSFFRHQLKIKMYHFQTQHYGAHKASDSYLGTFESNLDKFMEIGQGIVGKFNTKSISIKFDTLNDETINFELDKFVSTLRAFDEIMKGQTELLNLRDEMIGNAEQFKYLLTFK